MAKVIQFPRDPSTGFGLKKAGKKTASEKREQLGQLTLFPSRDAKVISLPKDGSFFEQALDLDEKGSKDAKRAYLLAVEQGDNVADAYCNLGTLSFNEENIKEALDYLTLALKENPRHLEAHFNLANLYFEKGNFELAKLHYESAISIEPDFTDSYYNLGLVLISNREYEQAIKVLLQYRMAVTTDSEVDTLIQNLKRMKES